ncbi:MAG: DUF748 domain-containing protein [Candidatus Rokubacteria bacterium]|nr:DUF748 domain-containing protein [Candidatus Rokubacteria bacterium]
MSRRRTIWLVVAAVLLVLGGAFLWALPELIRRQAVTQIPKITGRAASIGDIDLNLFTGRLVVKNFRLAERDPQKAFVEFERLEARWSWPSLLAAHIRLKDVTLVSPAVQLARTGPREFNFSDLLGLIPPADPKAKPSRWTFTMERLGLVLGNIVIRDEAVSPPATWRIQGLTIEAGDLTTRAGQPAGRLAIQSKVGDSPFELSSNEIRLAPGAVSLGLGIKNFDLIQVLPYVSPTAPAGPYGGRLGFNIKIGIERGAEGVTRAVVSGDMSLDDLQLIRPGGKAPFMTVPHLGLRLKEADLISRVIVVSDVEIVGLKGQALRDKSGVIDLLQAAATPPAAVAPPPTAARPAPPAPPAPQAPDDRTGPAFKFLLEKLALSKATLTFVDEMVSPPTTLALSDLTLSLESVAWPVVGPAKLSVGAGLPGSGRVEIKGSLIPQPLDMTWTMTVRDAPIEPYQSYMPVPARFSGRYNGDSKNRVALRGGKMILTSTGTSWADKFEARFPGAERPSLTIERMELVSIDLDWPNRAKVAKVGFRRLQAEIERGKDGSLDIVKLFGGPAAPAGGTAPAQTAPAPSASDPAPTLGPAPAPKPKGLLDTMDLQFGEIRLEEGGVRFLDRSTEPVFSEDLSNMDLQVTGLGNKPDQRAKLVFTSLIGADGKLDIRGDLGAIGAPLYLDLVGEIRDLKLPIVNPYSDQTMAWLIQQGNLKYKFNLKIENDQITAMNEVLVEKLRVAKSSRPDDNVKARLGLPLGLIVALIKDGNGNIVVKVPVSGSLKDPKFDLSETIWSAVKKVLVNVLASPFRLIGRMFSSEEKLEEPKVNPVTFPAGSAVLAPSMEQHLLRVADFMRQTPYIALTLHPVVVPGDLDAIKAEAVAAKVQQFAKERGIAEQVMAIRGYFAVRLPSEKLPTTPDAQLALLRDREPVPEAKVKELEDKRLAVTKERLVKKEGIQEKRLPGGAAKRSATGEGGVEFAIGEGEEE